VQWVLHNQSPDGGKVMVSLRRGSATEAVELQLPAGWRTLDDISWRVSAWGLRRMVTGGLLLESIDSSERGQAGIPRDGMALRVRHVGQYGPHAAAKQAGFQAGDILISFDGRNDLLTDSDVLRYGASLKKPGDRVPVEIVRAGEQKTLQLPMQE